jgi:hypothetical protein
MILADSEGAGIGETAQKDPQQKAAAIAAFLLARV